MSENTPGQTITVAAVALLRGPDVLLVRKRGTARFMLLGGKYNGDESAIDCALREVAEEIGLHLNPADIAVLGRFTAPAANEPGHIVLADVFVATTTLEPTAQGEIAELRWHAIASGADDLAPLLKQHVLPALNERTWAPSCTRPLESSGVHQPSR